MLDRGVGCLIEDTPHVAVTLGRAMALVDSRALFISGTCSHPRRELLRGRKCCCCGTYFGDDLLSRIYAQAGDLCQPLHRILTWVEPSRDLLVQFLDRWFDSSQLFQHHLQEPPVDGVELRARSQCFAPWCRSGA